MTTPCTEKETLDRIELGVKSILETLNGNGKIGLKTQVELHKTYFTIAGAIGGPLLVGLIVTAVTFWLK